MCLWSDEYFTASWLLVLVCSWDLYVLQLILIFKIIKFKVRLKQKPTPRILFRGLKKSVSTAETLNETLRPHQSSLEIQTTVLRRTKTAFLGFNRSFYIKSDLLDSLDKLQEKRNRLGCETVLSHRGRSVFGDGREPRSQPVR